MALNADDWKSFQKSEELHQFSNDPDENPYQSKYEGRAILKSLSEKLKNLIKNQPETEPDLTLKSALACVLYTLAINFVDTEERPEGEKTILEIFKILKTYEQNYQTVSINMACKNYLGYIYCDRSDYENSLHYLNLSDQSYRKYKEVHSTTAPPWELTTGLQICCTVLSANAFTDDTTKKDFWLSFEKLHTYTLFYLAQLCKNLNEFSKSASYCQQTLVKIVS